MENTPTIPAILLEEIRNVHDREISQAVTVILPAYNEGSHIAGEIRAVRSVMDSSGWDFEILVVDDGSTDLTGERAASESVRVLRQSQNRGYGAAIKRGIADATYDWILVVDADGTYPASALPLLLEHASEYDMIVGARTGAIAEVPYIRRPAKWALGLLASFLAGQKFPDLNSGLRLMRRQFVETYLHLLPSGFSFTTTITLAAACNDHPVTYVPIDYHARLGKSKIHPLHAYTFLLLILRTIIFFNPLKVFLPVGFFLACLGLGKFTYDVAMGDITESALLGILGALIVWAVGLLADQNARIHSQSLKSQRGW